MATQRGMPDVRHIYSVTDMRAPQPRKLRCISCHLLEQCSHFDARFSPNATRFLLQCTGPGLHRTLLMRTEPPTLLQTLHCDQRLKDKHRRIAMPQIRLLELPLASQNTVARIKLLLPPALELQENIRYPAVLKL